MTSPGSGAPVRGGATTRARAADDVGGILILLALALTFRAIIAYLLPGSGFANDIGAFQYWASNLATDGLHGFYDRPFFHDYTPGYLYVLWIVGLVGNALGGVGDLIKIPPILGDVALAYLVWSMTLELGAGRRAARLAAVIVAVNPITWFDSVIWAQVDSVGVVFLLLGVRELWRDRPERSAILTVIAAITKPQLGILVPIVAAVTIRRALWPSGGDGDEDAPAPRRTTTRWEATTRGPVRILTTGLAGLVTAFVLCVPFGLSFPYGLVEQIFKTAGGYPYASVNAWNPWAFATLGGSGVAANHLWACDMVVTGVPGVDCPVAVTIGGIPVVIVGTVATVLVFLAVSVIVARRPDRVTILVGLAALALAFFVVPTRVHERYLYPLVVLGVILAAVSLRWRIAYLASAAATFANLYFVLTTLYPNNPGIADWLGIGPALGSTAVISIAAMVQVGVFLFVLSELRASATRRLATDLEMRGVEDDRRRHAEAPAPRVDEPERTGERLRGAQPPSLAMAGASGTAAGAAGTAAGAAGTAAGAAVALPLLRPGRPADATAGRPWPVWLPRGSTGELGLMGWFRQRLHDIPIRPARTAGLEAEPGGRVDRLDIWIVLVMAAVLLTGRVWRLGEPVQFHFDEVYHPRTGMEFLQDWRYGISHYIYEWTHPHLAKYAMALGIEAWGNDRVTATSDLGVDVRAAAVEPRWDDGQSVGRIEGDRLWIATGSEVRAYDLATRALIVRVPVAGAASVSIDRVYHRVVVGSDDGTISLIDTRPLDQARWDGTRATASAQAFADVGAPIRELFVPSDAVTVEAVVPQSSGGEAVAIVDVATAAVAATVPLDGIGQISDAGAGTVAVATAGGVAFIDTTTATLSTTIEVGGPVEGLDLVTNLDKDRIYASYDSGSGQRMATIVAPGGGGAPTKDTTFPLPGATAGWVGYDVATQTVYVLGETQDGTSSTAYLIEPHANAVYEDASLPFQPAALVLDNSPRYPSADREQLLALAPTGAAATVDTGQNPFSWRLPGVLCGVLMAVLLYLLARVLFRRRSVAVFLAIIMALDGMLFAQSRIGMNDAYVGLGIVAAYLLFAWLWHVPRGGGRSWLAFVLGMPMVGLLLGLALASKWVAAYAIGALGILVLARSALGRVILILGLVAASTALGYLGISVPDGQSGANYLFLGIMVALTLLAVIVAVTHPVAWTDEEQRLATFGPAVAGMIVFLVAVARGVADKRYVLGSVSISPQEAGLGLVVLSAVVWTIFVVVGRWGFGPMAAPAPPDDPAALLPPPAPAPGGWLRPGAGLGLPMLYVLACLVLIPVAVYVLSYVPWAFVEDHQLWPGWPPGHTGQTLWDLTQAMYTYHNTLSSPHPASSPWWAWLFDFKPVWFYQQSFAGGTSAAIYDSGNLVAWWFAIPALAFVAWQAYARRSAALALVMIGFACQWIAWARIDRAAFQYHYYTSLPFVFLALAYFLAELWQGASRRTWLLARIAGGAMVMAPAVLWLFHRPLCGFVGVLQVAPDSRACPTLIPDFVLTGRALAIALVVGVGVLILVRLLLQLAADDEDSGTGTAESFGARLRNMALAAIAISIAFLVASAFFDETQLIKLTNVPVEPIALLVTLALVPVAAFVATARDARRFVAGVVVAMAGWFVLWYPNFSGLPLPSALSNPFQGLLPTYVYPFQFPVSTVDRSGQGPSLVALGPLLLLVTIAGVCVAVGYSAWIWRISLAERDASAAGLAIAPGGADPGQPGNDASADPPADPPADQPGNDPPADPPPT